MSIAALVLAAGPSRRLGRPKQLEPWGGMPLLGRVLHNIRAWPVDEIWVVLGASSDEIMEQVDFGDAGIVVNPEWEEGLASSLRAGLDALARSRGADAALIVLGDQPDVDPEVVRQIITRYEETGAMAVVPKYRYTWGNPVLVDKVLWSRLMSIEGDQGARKLLQAHPEWVEEVWVETLPPRDVDTEDDVDQLRP